MYYEDPKASVRKADRKISDLRKKHFPEQVVQPPSSIVYGSAAVHAHKHVRTFETIFSSWLVGLMYDIKIGAPRDPDSIKDFFPQEWIRFLAGVDVQDGTVAMTMLRNQAKNAEDGSGPEESGRSSEKSLEESIVCHLTRVFLTTHDAFREIIHASAAAASPRRTESEHQAAPEQAASASGKRDDMCPLQLKCASADQTPSASTPSVPAACRERQRMPSEQQSTTGASPQRYVNLGIAQVVCRPGASNPAQKVSRVSNAVQQVLHSYEARDAALATQQHISEKRGLDNIFTVEKMIEIREKLKSQKQAEVLVNALRSAQNIELHNSPAVQAALNSHEKLSMRPRPPSGKVEASPGADVMSTPAAPAVQHPFSAVGLPGPQRLGSARSVASNPCQVVGSAGGAPQQPLSARPRTAYAGTKKDWLPLDSRVYAKMPL